MATKAVKMARKLERPRPLKVITEGLTKSPSSLSPGTPASLELSIPNKITTVDDVVQELENLHVNINNGNFDEKTQSMIAKICNQLKSKGQQLEAMYKEQLDHYFVTLRNASRDERMDMLSRLRLLEVIELRAMLWKNNENLTNYYKIKFQELEGSEQGGGTPLITTPTSVTTPPFVNQIPMSPISPTHQPSVTLGPGEVLKTSGKFPKPTKIPGKNYFKDEIVIRNSDSGKVMGIKGRRVHMIEELSETIISFQRVNPGARDRLVQITGPHENAIMRGKALIEDTIRRNASPVRERLPDTPDVKSSSSTGNLGSSISEENSNIPLNAPSANFRKQLVHSYSMSDASVGEYSYSIIVGRHTIKVASTQVDLVRTAKLVLEEYFAGQAELSEKLSQPTAVPYFTSSGSDMQPSKNRRPMSIHMDSPSYLQDMGHWEYGGHIASSPSYSSSNAKAFWLCNGGTHSDMTARESSPCSTSSSEEGTFKEGSTASEEDHCSANKDASSEQKTEIAHVTPRQVSALQSSASKGTVVTSVQLQLKASPTGESPVMWPATSQVGSGNGLNNIQNKQPEVNEHGPVTAHQRRGMYATVVAAAGSKDSESGSQVPAASSSATRRFSGCDENMRIAYTRDFILRCAKSPLSQAIPEDYQQITKQVPFLIRENPKMFDPTSYFTEPSASKVLEQVQIDSSLNSQQSQESWPPENVS